MDDSGELQAVRERGLGDFAAFPDELLCYLLASHLEVPDLLALSQASKLFRVFACEEPLWLQKHLDRCARPFSFRGSWRATYLAYQPRCGRPQLTAADLPPPPAVPGFSSLVLYRRWCRCHMDVCSFLPLEGAPAGAPPVAAAANGSGAASSTAAAAAAGPAGAAGAATGGAGPGAFISAISCIPDASGMSPAEFEQRFDGPRQPVMLGGLTRSWQGAGPELEAWQPAALAQRFGDRLFKVTKPFLAGGRTRMRLADYLSYCAQQHDEEPLYVFDASFGEAAPELLARYQVPHLFRHDLFACLGYQREEYRWLVIGPARSGASWHIDPSATSAWNTLLSGRKRWALYPPGRTPPGVRVHISADGSPDFEAPTSLQWFLEVFPQLPPDQRPLEVVQHPGETIFLPAGWWHCVLNLDLSVALTQNFVSPANLESAVQWQALAAGSMLDPRLVPAYLRMRQREENEEQAAAAAADGGQAGEADAGRPAKRPRRQGRAEADGGEAAGEVEAAEAAAEEEEEVEEHLSELPLGFARDSLLGPWLRRILLQGGQPAAGREQVQNGQQQEEEQQLADRAWQLALQWTDLPAWQQRLAAACRAAGLPPPACRHKWLPLATGLCMVFEVGGAIVKFFRPDQPWTSAMACMEAGAHLSHSLGSSERPALLCAGVQEMRQSGGADGRELSAPLPFVVLRKSPGVTLGSCFDGLSSRQWLAVAAAAGRSLAAFHLLPLPASGGQNGVGSSLGASNGASSPTTACTAWVVRDGVVHSSRLGQLDMRQDRAPKEGAGEEGGQAAMVQRQRLILREMFPGVGALLAGGPAGQEGSPAAAAAAAAAHAAAGPGEGLPPIGSSSTCQRCRAWQPFAAFLRRQRRHAVQAHRRDGSLPAQLLAELDSYLPAEPAVLAGLGACESCSVCACGPAAGGSAACGQPACCNVSAAGAASGAGGSAGGACGGSMPAWVHGDLTAENLLVSWGPPEAWPGEEGRAAAAGPQTAAGLEAAGPQAAAGAEQQQQQAGAEQQQGLDPGSGGRPVAARAEVALIDFADSGHGDPLWDFVLLLPRTLRCSQPEAEACLAAYCSALSPGPAQETAAAQGAPTAQLHPPLPAFWPRRPPGITLSFAAMCYTLLHELGPLRDVFKRRPELWEASSLAEVQQAVWGWLDGRGGPPR